MEQALLQRVKARVTIEMLGAPKEHVQKTLKDYVEKLKKEPTVEILKIHYAEPEKREGDLYAVFAEVEAYFKDAGHLIAFCFDAMPSTVEIMEPVEIKFQGKEFEGLLNDLQARLHTVDRALKQLKALNKIIDTNAFNVLHNFILYLVRQGDKTGDELGQIIGLPADNLKPFLDKLLGEKKIKREGEKYSKV